MAIFTHKQFVDQLLHEIPEIHAEVTDETWAGLLHLEMACFARFTQQAIDEENADCVRRCFSLATKVFMGADADVKNAVYVSYLEHLNFQDGRSRRDWAIAAMPAPLKVAWGEITAYMDQLAKRKP